jgi:hypothetical protein
MNTYAGIYENGKILWEGKPTVPQRAKVLITILEEIPEKKTTEKLSTKLRGAWKNKSVEEKQMIDEQIKNLRNEWERPIS